jgi:cytochrome c oxidase cbb3-type subunit III
MLNKKIFATLALGLLSAPLFAKGTMGIEWVSNDTILYALYFLIVILILMVYMLGKTLNHINSHFSEDGDTSKKSSVWGQLFQVNSVSTDKDMMLDHEYDGIRELGNPPPPWFMFLFYGTIVIAAIYFYRFSISGDGPTQMEEYITEVQDAEAAKKAALAAAPAAGPDITASTVVFSDDAAAAGAGKILFNGKCKVCHGAGGMGIQGVGPNLSDEFWIHGGSASSIFSTIENGVSGKMVPWKGLLTGKQISDVIAYIHALDAVDESAGGKGPEGKKYVPELEQVAPSDATSTESSDTAS